MIFGNCWLVTMDDAGTEHRHGWIRIEDGLVDVDAIELVSLEVA